MLRLAHGLLDHADFLRQSPDADAAAAAISEACDIGDRLRCQPLLDTGSHDRGYGQIARSQASMVQRGNKWAAGNTPGERAGPSVSKENHALRSSPHVR